MLSVKDLFENYRTSSKLCHGNLTWGFIMLSSEELGVIGLIVPLIVFVLLVILLPFSAYAAQKWANRTYKEAVKMNKKLDKIAALLEMRDEYPLPSIDPNE